MTERPTQEGIAARRIGFRNENERIYNTALASKLTGQLPFICECADPSCSALVQLGGDAYQVVRTLPRGFFNITGHEAPSVAAGVERVIAVINELTIIMTVGRAGELALEASTRPKSPTSADRRDQVADERERAADERERAADERERAADEREQVADVRQRADERDPPARIEEMNRSRWGIVRPWRNTNHLAWHIVDMRDIELGSDRDTVQAVEVYLMRVDNTQSRIVVELSRTASESGWGLDPYQAAEAYLDFETPPRLLVVESDGTAYPSD
jgi:hypothetical protein